MMRRIGNIQQRWQATSHLPLHERIKGFTLIELLVVVAIIGLLAAIVIAPLNIARTKGSNARNLETDAAMYHNLGDSMVLQMRVKETFGRLKPCYHGLYTS